MNNPKAVDVHVRNCGTLALFTPLSPEAKAWVDENVQSDATWFGRSLVVEHRYVSDLYHGMSDAGFTIAHEREA